MGFVGVAVGVWLRRLDGWDLKGGEEVVGGEGLTRKERARMERVMVRKYILELVQKVLENLQ